MKKIITDIWSLPVLISCTFIPVQGVTAEGEGNSSHEVATTESLPELPPVTVSASPLTPSLLEYGKPVSVMNSKEIDSRLESTLGETIRLEPGVRSSFFGAGASRPVIRGFGGDRVRVLKNGVTTGDVSDLSEDHVVATYPMQAEQIEILRGPETLLYGSGAIGGAVNVTDDSIPEMSLGKPFEGKALMQGGNSADNEKTLGAKLRGEVGSFNWYVSGFSRESDDYEIPGSAESSALRGLEESFEDDGGGHEPEGKAENTDSESFGATLGGSYVWEKGFFGVSFGGFNSEYGVPGHVHHSEDHEGEAHHEVEEEHGDEEDGVRIDAEQARFDVRGRVDDVSDVVESVKFRAGYADYKHDEIEDGGIGTTYERDTVETRVELLHSEILGVRGALGFQALYDDFSALGEEAFLTPVKTYSPALFIFEETSLAESLNFRFGGRVERVHHSPDGFSSKDFVPFSLSAGPQWDPTGAGEYNVGLTFTYTERAPNSVELFSEGQHLARQIYEVGAPSLGKETSWGADLVLSKNDGFLTGAFTPFYQGFSNYINLAGTGLEDEGLPVFTYEEIEAYFWGFEFESTLHLDELFSEGPHGFAIDYQADYVRARQENGKGDLPRVPPLRNIVRARYNYQESFESFIEGVFVEAQDDLAEFEIPTQSYALLNVEMNMDVPFLESGDYEVFMRGTNLTDREARVHSSFVKDLAPLRGRAFLFGLRAQF